MRAAIALVLVVLLASSAAAGASDPASGGDFPAAGGERAGVGEVPGESPHAGGNAVPANAPANGGPPLEAPAGEQPEIEAPGDDAPVELTLFVREFRFDGNTVVSDEELKELLSPVSWRRLTLNDLHLAAAAVALHYPSLGYFAADAILPPQEIVDGIVTIRVFEGRYDRLVIDNRSTLRDGVTRTVFPRLKPDALIKSGPYERATLLLAESPGVEAYTSLAPGGREGTADLVVLLQDGKQAAGQFALESRSPAGGPARFTASLSLAVNNPFGRDDQIITSVSAGGTPSVQEVVEKRGSGSMRCSATTQQRRNRR